MPATITDARPRLRVISPTSLRAVGGSALAAAAPPAVPLPTGASFALDAGRSYLATDASHLTPPNNTDLVRWVQEYASGGWYEQATEASRPMWRLSSRKGYLDFDGAQVFRFPTGLTLPQGQAARTIGVAIRPPVTSAVDLQPILSYGTNENNKLAAIGIYQNDRIYVTQFGNAVFTADNTLTVDSWVRVIATVTGDTWTVYLNGTQSATGAISTNTTGSGLYIGSDLGTEYFRGDIARAIILPSIPVSLTETDNWLRAGYP